MAMFNEEKDKKDKLKKQVYQLTKFMIKITKSSEVVKPVASSVDEKIIRQAEQINSHGSSIGEWMDRLLSQETHLIGFVVTLVNNLEGVRSKVDKTLDLFSQELDTYEKEFDSWLKLQDFQLDVLVDNGVLPSKDIYIEQRAILDHQMNMLEVLIKDMRKAHK